MRSAPLELMSVVDAHRSRDITRSMSTSSRCYASRCGKL
ncbi:hypothetical protein A7982_12049 [Minicystis rosea]|nr:hypothetical protein A7982_12049 [Minicystis rosea]